jgi:hypothetical protein
MLGAVIPAVSVGLLPVIRPTVAVKDVMSEVPEPDVAIRTMVFSLRSPIVNVLSLPRVTTILLFVAARVQVD